MKKVLKYSVMIQFLALTVLLFGGCRSYDNPAEAKVYSDAEILAEHSGGLMTIAEVKQIYYDIHSSAIGKGVKLDMDAVVKGKVISNDSEGNIYRTMYIQDATGAIEVKHGMTNSQNMFKPGRIVYIRLKDLVLGNYRFNLGLGGIPKEDSDYANAYMDVLKVYNYNIGKTVNVIERGEMAGFTAADTLVVRSMGQLTDANIGQLIRIEGVESIWDSWDNTEYPTFLYTDGVTYIDYQFVKVIKEWQDYYTGATSVRPTSPRIARSTIKPPYAFKNPETNVSYYGSSLFRIGGSMGEMDNFILRVSGYSKFANEPIPNKGKKVNITAMFVKYSSKSGGFKKNQLLLNSHRDIMELP